MNKITLIALAAGTLAAGSLSAQIVTYYGVADNAIAAGVTGVDGFSAIANTDWHDTYLDGGNPTGADGLNPVASVRGEKTGGVGNTNLNILSAFAFDGLTIADPIQTASLRLYMGFAIGTPFNVFLGGIGTGSGFSETTSTYDSIVTGGFASIANTANPVSVTSPNGWFTFDVTSLLQDFLAGNNDGIYLNISDTFSGSAGDQPRFNFATSEDTFGNTPGLVVTTVPEPSAALLIGLGVLGLVVRRRR